MQQKVFDLRTLNGTNGFTIVPPLESNRIQVNTAGDINADGLDDLVIGVPSGSDNNPSVVYVIFGQLNRFSAQFDLNTLNGTNGFKIIEETSWSSLGSSVSTAGDINGDGVKDLVIGASGTNNKDGACYVIFGQKEERFPATFNLSTLNGTNGFRILGGVTLLGRAVSTTCDINGDNFDDVVVGAPSPYESSLIYVIFGQKGNFPSVFNVKTLNGTNGFMITYGNGSGNKIVGDSVNSAGDMNGDKIDDLVFNVLNPSGSPATAAFVLFGRSAFPPLLNLALFNNTDGFQILSSIVGRGLTSVNTAGDINDDGLDDVILGNAKLSSAHSYIIFGKSQFPSSVNIQLMNSTTGFSVRGLPSLGYSVSRAGDINGDKVMDIVLGAGDLFETGGAYVIFGRPCQFPTLFDSNRLDGIKGFAINALYKNQRLGSSVSTAGDINGDKFADLILASSKEVYVIFGPAGMSNVTHHSPQVINPVEHQVVEINKPFNFTIETNEVFENVDGDPLTFSIQTSNKSQIPTWLQFNNNDTTLTFTGTPLSIGNTSIILSAKDWCNEVAQTEFTISSINPNIGSNAWVTPVAITAAGVLSLAALLGAAYRKWLQPRNHYDPIPADEVDNTIQKLKVPQLS